MMTCDRTGHESSNLARLCYDRGVSLAGGEWSKQYPVIIIIIIAVVN